MLGTLKARLENNCHAMKIFIPHYVIASSSSSPRCVALYRVPSRRFVVVVPRRRLRHHVVTSS